MSRTCHVVFLILTALYMVALAIYLIGVLGLFGAEPDPVSAVFLIPLGWPWNRAIAHFPDATGPWLIALAPLLSLLVIRLICGLLHGGYRR